MSDLFGAPEGNMVGVDDKGNTLISRVDLGSYERYLDQVQAKGPGFEARLVVNTGDPVITKAGKRTGRGKEEAKHDRAFRQVASNREQGIRIVPEHLTDGTTMLRIALTGKREFSELTVAKRDRGRINYQATQAVEKTNKLPKGSPEQVALGKHARELIAQVKALDVKIAELENGSTKVTAPTK